MAEPQDAQRPQLELLDMPPELLAEVFLRCSQETKHAFRLSCKQARDATTRCIHHAHKLDGPSVLFQAEDAVILARLPALTDLDATVEVPQLGSDTYAIPEPNYDPNPFAKEDDRPSRATDSDASDPWAALLRLCRTHPSLSRLSLRAVDVAPLQADEASGLTQLTRLSVSPSEWFQWSDHVSSSEPEFVPGSLEGLWALTGLQSLALVGSRAGNTHRMSLSPSDVRRMAGLSSLRELSLERFCVECWDDPGLDQLTALSALTSLAISDAFFYSGCDRPFDGLSRLCHLRALRLPYLHRASTSGAPPYLDLETLQGMSSLTHLDLSASSLLSDEGMQYLHCVPALQCLLLSAGPPGQRRPLPKRAPGAGITDEGLPRLVGLTSLTRLSLAWNEHVTWAGVAVLAALRGLQALDLSECALTDYQPSAVEAGTRAIAVMEGLTHFRIDMSVSGRLDERTAQRLCAALGGLPSLSRISAVGAWGCESFARVWCPPMENLRNLAVLVLGCSGDDVGIADAAQGDVGDGAGNSAMAAPAGVDASVIAATGALATCPWLAAPFAGTSNALRGHSGCLSAAAHRRCCPRRARCNGHCVLVGQWMTEKDVLDALTNGEW